MITAMWISIAVLAVAVVVSHFRISLLDGVVGKMWHRIWGEDIYDSIHPDAIIHRIDAIEKKIREINKEQS